MNQDNELCWLHLSDFHLKSDADVQIDQNYYLESLLSDIEKQIVDHELDVDLVFITGDLAFSGNVEEYIIFQSFMEKLLEILSSDGSNVYFVPGNHDVLRPVSVSCLCFCGCLQNQQIINSFFSSDDERKFVIKNQSNYFQYVDTYYPHISKNLLKEMYFSSVFLKNGIKIAILGLNSSWLSKDNSDRANLLIGSYQVKDAFLKAEDPDLVISLMHHPLEWLKDFDSNEVSKLLFSKSHFILRGHDHNIVQNFFSDDIHDLYIIGSGVAYESKGEYKNSYNIIRLNLDNFLGESTIRCQKEDYGWETYKNPQINLTNKIIKLNNKLATDYNFDDLMSIDLDDVSFHGKLYEFISSKYKKMVDEMKDEHGNMKHSESVIKSLLFEALKSMPIIRENIDSSKELDEEFYKYIIKNLSIYLWNRLNGGE